MKFFILLTTLLTSNLFAFTLVSNPAAKFPMTEIVYNVSNNSCDNINMSVYTLLDHAEKAVDKFWNSIPTSALYLKKGGIVQIDLSNDTGSIARSKTTINTILIGCSSNANTFANASTAGVGGISTSSLGTKGALIINNATSSLVSNYGETSLHALIAHELGHTIGIHHSNDPIALMYYSLSGKTQEHLAQDDVDAATYLYPHEKKAAGLFGSCGTINIDNNNFPGNGLASMTLSMMMVILLGFFRKKSYLLQIKNNIF